MKSFQVKPSIFDQLDALRLFFALGGVFSAPKKEWNEHQTD